MNIVEEFRRDEIRVLDRLVDGELGQAERCELLSALDDEPGAWRRCALAFLESQNWRWQLTRLTADRALADQRRAQAADTVPLARRGSFWGLCLSVAAGLLVAFGLGTRYAATSTNVTPSSLQVATEEPGINANVEPNFEADPAEVEEPLDMVTLALADGEGEAEHIELPVASAGADESEWLDELESGLSADLLERLRAAGVDVVRSQRLYPVDLSDGRRLVVPVEQVDLRHSGFLEEL
jgi:hypothetical protein